jgi:hypothetical protein
MHIVVWDPEGEWWEGGIIPEQEQARELTRRGVVLLPVMPELLRVASNAGYYKRSWGRGVSLTTGGMQPLCPLSIYALHDVHYLHWVARLVPTPSTDVDAEGKPKRIRGMFSIVPDGTQRGALAAGLMGAERDRVQLERLPEMDRWGGWTVGGAARIQQMLDTQVGVTFHGGALGQGPQLRVAWAAVTQTNTEA